MTWFYCVFRFGGWLISENLAEAGNILTVSNRISLELNVCICIGFVLGVYCITGVIK